MIDSQVESLVELLEEKGMLTNPNLIIGLRKNSLRNKPKRGKSKL